MRLPLRKTLTYAIGAAILSPAMLFAASDGCGTCNAEPTAESYTWNFTKEGSQLLNRINDQIRMVKDDAATLERQDVELNWKTHSITLDRMKTNVNKAGDELCRLQEIQHTLQPWQQEALARIAPEMKIVATNTQNAIEFLQDNRQDLYNPTYEEYISNVYERADRVNLFVNYSQMKNRVNMATERPS